MVGAAVYRHHITLDAYDAVYQTNLCIFRIQYRPLLNVRFQEGTDLAFLPGGFSYLLRVLSIFFHCVIYGYSVFITEFLRILYIAVS